ncbi:MULTISPECIES: hypothetical protein [unclassified Streptomyces]|uniref:hypothetical protein n=1 Tax=unclassified Streptomyces TaxID=2593676 RepID=UPI002DDC27B5|nr:hypothetical protein [Streptomyces sp. NBC_01445]WSE09250.1 hypothetical protein OG574_41350 [Streptomyces sp. NBC_01445]
MLGLVFLLMFPISRVIGFGDVKLALSADATLGWYGWRVLLPGLFAGYVTIALYGITL